MFAFLNVDKPLGLTSHDVVARVRRFLREQGRRDVKVGHAGTLDPLATGVLVVCLGPATRLSEYVMNHRKTYRATITLGVETTTYDAEGAVVRSVDASHVGRDDIERALSAFVGDIAQMPPMYSAIKQDGRKLYDLARAGQTVERAARPVTIDAITIEQVTTADVRHPVVVCEVKCSAGTYIRSLAHDLGEALGVGAHLAALRRTASGAFPVEAAVSLEALAGAADWTPLLTPPLAALQDFRVVNLNDDDWEALRHGRTIPAEMPDDTIALGTRSGELCAVMRADSGLWHPHKVFLPAQSG